MGSIVAKASIGAQAGVHCSGVEHVRDPIWNTPRNTTAPQPPMPIGDDAATPSKAPRHACDQISQRHRAAGPSARHARWASARARVLKGDAREAELETMADRVRLARDAIEEKSTSKKQPTVAKMSADERSRRTGHEARQIGPLYWRRIAFAAVVSFAAMTKLTTITAYRTRRPRWRAPEELRDRTSATEDEREEPSTGTQRASIARERERRHVDGLHAQAAGAPKGPRRT
jgi:hypothetical protein